MHRHVGVPFCAVVAVLFAVAVQSRPDSAEINALQEAKRVLEGALQESDKPPNTSPESLYHREKRQSIDLVQENPEREAIRQQLTCDVARGWEYGGRDECYKVYYGNDVRSWHRAREICNSYGARLVNIHDQKENDLIGALVARRVGAASHYWIGLSNNYDGCTTCPDLTWHGGPQITNNQGMWADRQPDDDEGDCVFAGSNPQDYCYDRPYVWSFDKCVRQRPFVCEKMAIPEGTFPCFTEGHARTIDQCDGVSNCADGSDELNCPGRFRYFHSGPSGTLTRVDYLPSRTVTWAIQTPEGTNAIVRFQNFQTESDADIVIVLQGSLLDSRAQQVAILSGNQGNPEFRSYNNMMLVKFTTDADETAAGFVATWDSVSSSVADQSLIATPTVKNFPSSGVFPGSFLGWWDYVIVIHTEDQTDQLITLEVTSLTLHDSDVLTFYNGDSPYGEILATMCNQGCDNTKLVYSTGTAMYIILQTGRDISGNVNLAFNYRQGCYYETTDEWGELFSPGFPAGLDYPNSMTCQWVIRSSGPVSFLFDSDTVLADEDYGRVNNGDFLKIYDDGADLHTDPRGFGTIALRGQTIQATTGRVVLEFITSPNRAALGFRATWSIGCPDPQYDANTIVNTVTPVSYYTAEMTLSCARGFDFLQTHIPANTNQVQMRCGYRGVWLQLPLGTEYRQVPRCSPKYCDAPPNIANGYIDYITGPVYQDVAVYRCFPGSVIRSGTGNSTCENNGAWTQPPTCEAAECNSFNLIQLNIQNGFGVLVTGSGNGREIGSIIEYECNSGYSLIGSPITSCADGGQGTAQYTHAAPSCIALTCYLPNVPNQQPWGDRTISFNQQVNLLCMTGYEVSNSALNPIRCQANRTITEMPMCVDIDECGPINPCSDGCDNTDGSFTCTCPSGYRLQANLRDCEDINECLVQSLHNCAGQCRNLPGSYECSCNAPFTLYDQDGVSGYQIPFSENGRLPSDTYYLNHSCVYLECPTPDASIANADLMYRQDHYRVGDKIAYQCRIGFRPRMSVLQCGNNGQWTGTVPDCIPATCPPDVVNNFGFVNPAAYNTGSHQYTDTLYLNCTIAGNTFSKYRHCTYDAAQDTYLMQGSGYDCGDIDCGEPESVGGSFYSNRNGNYFGDSFTFTCQDNSLSGSSEQGDSIVHCQADGNWDFGSLTCLGRSCVNPGFPAGGNIVATSLADQQQVTFTCDRSGYSLTDNTPLVCNGDTFNRAVPQCVDTDDPVFTNCDRELTLVRYESIAGRLPQNTFPSFPDVRDNTGIWKLEVSPADANTSRYLTQEETITYTATDFAGNFAVCTVTLRMADETPPTVTCPDIEIISHSLLSSTSDFVVTENSITRTDNQPGTPVVSINNENFPTTFTSAHLYQTLTYTVQVFDQSNNVATCKSQIFVRPTSCSEASFRVPLNSAVTFNQVNFGLLRATVTCDTQYTFLTGKTITVECQGGTWQNYEPACVRDVTKPRLVCPSSQIIYYDNTAQTIDFTNLAVGTSDNNNMGPLQFQPETKTFTAADLYETTQVRVQVTDDAGNQGIGYFQYTLLPEPCSPAALPVTLDAQATTCNPTFGGYTCTIQCNDGYVLRGRGQSETISCTTGNAWGQIFTACIRDTLPPTLTCPESRVMYLSDANDFGSIDFTDINSGFQNYVTSDNSGAVPTVEFLPSVFDYGLSTLYQEPRAFVVRASDASGNRAQCTFEVAIVADVCSPLSLDSPVGGPPPQCDSTVNGWSCNITCNPGYEFYGTQASYIVTSCTTGNRFDTYVPGCVRSSLTVPKVFIGKLKYTYQPSDGTRNITDVSCINHYRQVQLERQNQMAGRLLTSCLQTYPYDIEVQFINSTFKVNKYRDTNGFERIVEILSNYRLINRGIHNSSKVHENCVSTYDTHIPNPNALFTFQASLPGDGNFCPEIVFSEAEHLPTSGAECFSPYYEDPNDVQACLLCPDGTESDSVFCSVCGLGEYSTEFGCMSCGTGYTTRYPGQRSSAACVRACDPGSISSTGYEPCFNCPRGSYSSDTRTCTPCQPGYTTSFFGSATSDSCQLESIVNVIEPCPIGTTSDGSGGCDLCPQGTYGTTFNSLCQTCQPIGASFTYVEGGTSSNVCKAYCGQGFISGTGMPPCQECPLGTRWINSTYCQACPPGFTTDGTGFIGCTVEAQIRVRCPPGMYRDAQEDCRKCPVGTYNSFEESSCSFCGTGKSTYSDGSTSVNMCFDMCAPGFSSASGLSPCTKCGVGRYWVNSTLCSDCPGAATTMTDTAVSSNECYDPCPAGQFSYNGYDVNGACRPCPFNHYQISPQATSCVRCAGNQYTLSQGSTSPNDCVSSAALCTSTTCANGGTCQFNTLNTYTCECAPGYYGRNCESTTNYCLSQPCYNNGQCQRTLNGYTCSCPTGTGGDRCETITPSCDRSTNNPTCDNGGYCIDYPNSFNCLCRDGFSGNTCSQNVSVCVSDPCNAAGTVFGGCREASNGKNLRRICQCRPGWTGRSCEINIDECASTPCINGGTCQNLENDFRCDCPGGYGGRYCHQRSDRCIAQTCNSPNSICVDDHRVDEPRCICETGYSHGVYTDYQLLINTVTADLDQFLQSNIIEDSSIDDCRATCDQRAACSFFVYATNERKCYLGGNQQLPTTSSSNHNLYLKQLSNPDTDFWTQSYDVDTPSSSNGYDDVESVTKLNNQYGLNICGGTEPLEARCCTGGSCSTNNFPVGMRCDIQGAVCEVGSSFNPCPDFSVQFKCAAHRVFKSNLCSIKNDYCSSSPCVRGSCRENPGDGYSCFCPAGYTGLNCQTDIDECANNPCMNDGVCTDLVADYECACDGFEGKNCQTPINYCFLNSVNCNNRGQCVNNRHGYECRCISGYTGQDCETMIDYCASSPCIHGSTCQPLLNDYNCGCEQGFFGKNCQFTVDNCAATSCFGSCYNLFNNYYCQCPPNVFGSNCENRPDPCGDYNICLNGGFCTDDDVTMSCACSAQYEGNGCEVRRDLCGVDNACQNGAECQLLASSPWYRCVCPSGYTGDNCDIDVNECSPNPCTPGAQCYDDINRYHCVCPIGRTGNNCARDFDPNYDLFIHHPQGLAYARTPYSVAVDTMNAMTISLWVRFAEADGEGVYMTTYIGGQFETATKFLEFTESGVRVYVPNGIVDLQYNRLVKINDGNWHLVHFAWDSVNGRVQIYADTIANVAQTNGWLINPDYSFRMWVVLGCEMEQSPMRCSGDNSFYGFLSQVTFYKRMLTFAGTATVPGEIPYIYANPRALIAPQEDWLLVWHGYLTESGVDRITPSEAKGDRCSKVGRNPPCRFYQATTLPYTNNCPSDITINSPDRVTEVTWTEPVFVNLRGGSVEKNYLPRSSLGWGEYHVQYVAESSDGYKAYCTFNIYIQNNPCPAFPNPFSGTQTSVSNNPVGWTAAVPSCIDGNQQTYSIDRYHPEVFTCGPSGHWNRALPNQRCRYPSCGPVQDQPKVTLKLRMIYKISTPACNATAVNIQVRVREEFVALQSIFTGTLCSNPACQDIETTVFCPENTDNNNFLRDTLVNIIVREADSTTNLDQNILKTEEFLRYFALAQDIFDFSETIPNGNILDNSFYITTTRVCPVGQVIIDGSCVTCGAGNFFRYVADEETTENAICDDCPLGFYEDRPGQSSCKQCPPGQTTEMTGTFDRFSCKNICPTGQYFDYGADGCLDCDIGYYQENEGQFRCDFCGAGFTTQNMGSDSADLCKATCVSGYELSGETCTPCQRGTYRNAALTRTCVQCPTGTITQDVASTSRDDCNIPACLEGTRYNMATNSCVNCLRGEYQDQKYQTECISCGDSSSYSTPAPGSTDQSACYYFCPSGFEVRSEGICDICEIGSYKDNDLGDLSTCTSCPPNYRTPGQGATNAAECTIYKCPVGYQPNLDNTDCTACPLGYYQDVANSVDCKQCSNSPIPLSTRDIASNSSDDCEAYCDSGYEKRADGFCQPCPRGTYKNNIQQGLFGTCMPCNAIFTTPSEASTSSDACTIRTCPPGTRRTADDTDCVGCPLDTYQPDSFQTSCLPCGNNRGTRQENSTSFQQCEDYCVSGYEKLATGCSPCPIGEYKNNDEGKFGMCSLCPIDKITANTASATVDLCTIGNCTAGSYRTGDDTCALCAKGTYQSQWWQFSCELCGTDKTTEQPGADDISLCILVCQPGFEDAGGFCTPCPRGFWKTEEAATTCKPCPTGTTTENAGTVNQAQCTLPACQMGYYLDRQTNPANPTCKVCPYDTYQDEIWMESCKPCPNGRVTLFNTATSSIDCVANCSSGAEYNSVLGTCDLCPRGYYRDQSDRNHVRCQMCPLDRITVNTGATDRSQCTAANCTTPGQYRDTSSNPEVCRACPLDEWQSQKWQTGCVSCPNNFGTQSTGSSSSDDCLRLCAPGTYLSTTGGGCLNCPRGTFKADRREAQCTPCPNGLLTANDRQTSDATCVISPCAAGEQYNQVTRLCNKCPIGFYQSATGQFDCNECPYDIKYTPNSGATSVDQCRSPCQAGEEFNVVRRVCDPCRRGYFQPQDNQFTCVQCPQDRQYTTQTGATSLNQCYSPCDNNLINDCSDNATCTVDVNDANGYTCDCFSSYDDVGTPAGRSCVHKCDRGYCNNGGACTRSPTPVCACSEWYQGDRCQQRIRGDDLADDTLMDIVIPVVIGVGGLVLFLILLTVCLLCYHKRKISKPPTRHTEYNGHDKQSLHSVDYGQQPYNGRGSVMMLAPAGETYYTNSVFKGDNAVYTA